MLCAGQYVAGPVSYHPSLTASVSVISSMYTPIASPSVSLPPKHLSSSARRPFPSPLITTMSRTPMAGLKPGQGLSAELLKHGGYRNHANHPHSSQLRKIQSAYYDLGRESQESKRNGILVHCESSPEFFHNPDSAAACKTCPHTALLAPTKPNAATQPSPLLQDGTNMELKIEYVDQLTESGATPTKSNLQKKDSRESLLGSKVTNGGSVKSKKAHDFIEEKQKFIHDAKQWSKRMGSNIAKKVVLPTLLPAGPEGAQSLNTDISPEEQEKILRQHFEQVQRSQSQLKPTTTVTPTRSPTLSSPSRSPKLPVRSSPIPTSLRLPAVTTGKIPFLHGQMSTSSMFPFLGGTPPLAPASGPITSPLPHYAGSGLNPFQAMMHYLAQHSNKPMIVTDPAFLQGLQGSLPDTVPCILPDGSMTLISSNRTLQREHVDQDAGNTSSSSSPPRIQAGKRGHTPEVDMNLSLPKRRRSNSLPDISQLGNKSLQKCHQDCILEGDEDSKVPPALVLKAPAHLVPGNLKTRDLPPPSMIHIPQDVKISDMMLGLPTPQSSPSLPSLSLSLPATTSLFQQPPPLTSVTSAFQHSQPLTPITPDHDTLSSDELKEIVQAEEGQPQLLPSPEDTSLPPCECVMCASL